MIKFEWDQQKSNQNLKKHGISFAEAATVFYSDQIRVFLDDSYSNLNEERLIAIGYSEKNRILTVVHCYRDEENNIRIISARKASKQEIKFFQGE